MNANLPMITDVDLAMLKSLPPHEQLRNELDRAIVVPAQAAPPDVVTMQSRVRYVDETTGERRTVTIVYPADADESKGRTSVLTPVGAALLGLSTGQTIEWKFPDGGWRRLRVEGVLRHPEARHSDGLPEASRPASPMQEIMTAIDGSEGLESLVRAAGEMRSIARDMLAQGVGAEALSGLIAAPSERLTGRILALESARHEYRGIRLCWLGLGSEARREQTFTSDQDNAIIFETAMPADAARARLLPFARAVNLALDACGFPLCRGEIMASNEKWCLSTTEWRTRFSGWIRNPGAGALLNATIFFDFRPLWGEAALAHDLRAWLNGMTREDQRFLHILAQDTVRCVPPIGLFGSFLTSGSGAARGTIDLKLQGTRVFTDAARIYALASGAESQNTAERLRHARSVLGGPADETEALIEASHFILLLRLRNQHPGMRESVGDRVNPRSLNEFQRSILKEALRQARKLQRRLAFDYRIH